MKLFLIDEVNYYESRKANDKNFFGRFVMKKYFVAIVMIIGVLTLCWSSFAQQAQKPAEKEKPATPAEPARMASLARLNEYLDLTPEQEAKLKDTLKARVEERKAFQEQIKKMRSELAPLLKDPKADQDKINSLIDQISKMRADQTKKALGNRKEFEKFLTPEQLDKLNRPRGRLMTRGPVGGFGRFMGPVTRPGIGPRGQGWLGNRWGRGVRMIRRRGLRF